MEMPRIKFPRREAAILAQGRLVSTAKNKKNRSANGKDGSGFFLLVAQLHREIALITELLDEVHLGLEPVHVALLVL